MIDEPLVGQQRLNELRMVVGLRRGKLVGQAGNEGGIPQCGGGAVQPRERGRKAWHETADIDAEGGCAAVW